MKILFITEWYPTKQQRVAGVFVREHAKAVQLFHDVVVLHCAGVDNTLPSLWRMEQETDEQLSEGIPTYRIWRRSLPIRRVGYLVYLWGVLQAFRSLRAQGFRPDIIHGNIYEAGAAAVMLGKLYRIPVVVTEHSTGFPRRYLKGLDVMKPWLTFRWANAVLPVSHSLQRAIEAYGIRGRFQIVPNVVDTALFAPAVDRKHDSTTRLLFVGNLESKHVKGVPYLLNAAAQLRHNREDWHLDIVGDGPSRADYEKLAADLDLGDLVTFHGQKPKSEIADLMRRADVFVLPSLWENLPCVVIEAIASGLPTVASKVGGIPELLNPTSGILVPPKDVPALAAALACVIASPEMFDRQEIARQAARFSHHAVGAVLDHVYRRILGRSRLPT